MGASIFTWTRLLALVASKQWVSPALLCSVSPGLLDGTSTTSKRGITSALVDGHNHLPLDGCEGDSGKGVRYILECGG